MTASPLEEQCEQGQRLLIETRYLEAVRTLVEAETAAWAARDFGLLARLYLPLQEARRQVRQRCGEGAVDLHQIATPGGPTVDPASILSTHASGQLLIAGWGTLRPAVAVRRAAAEEQRYLETFLAAAFPVVGAAPVTVIVPFPDVPLPPPVPRTMTELLALLPTGSLIVDPSELPPPVPRGTAATYAAVMALWEQLHAPFLATADAEPDPLRRMQAYRRVIEVDYACELAHQRLAATARQLDRA